MATAEPARAPVTRAQLDEAIRHSADLEIQLSLDALVDLGVLSAPDAERVERYLLLGQRMGGAQSPEGVLRAVAAIARARTVTHTPRTASPPPFALVMPT